MQCLKDKKQQFKLYPETNREPVERSQHRCDVVLPSLASQKPFLPAQITFPLKLTSNEAKSPIYIQAPGN